MATQYEVRTIAENIILKMGGDPEIICSGDCPEFAKNIIDALGGGVIVSNLFEMEEELEGYDVVKPEEYWPNTRRASHCWVKYNGINYDAFNPEGVYDETQLEFYQRA